MSTYGNYPFGIREVKITNIAGSTQVDLPAMQTLEFKERIKSAELSGADKLVTVVSYAEAVEWALAAGGIDLDAYALMTGRTVTTTGSTPDRIDTLTGSAQECFPFFKIYGKVLSDDCTADIHVKIFKAKLTEPIEGSFEDGSFFATSIKGIAVDDGSNGMYDFVQNETAASLPTS